MFRYMAAALALAGLAQAVCGQKPQGFGSVSGFVFCGDTNTPARLATVVLRPLPITKANASAPDGGGVEARMVQTSIDGSFSIPQVAPGRYYLLAAREGYISPLASLGISESDLLNPDEATRTRLLSHVPTVVVEGNLGASANISLERGAAVAGTILFDDGSPASGLSVSLLTRKQGKWVPIETGSGDGFAHGVKTDDRGYFRVSGIPPEGECLVKGGTDLIQFQKFLFEKWVCLQRCRNLYHLRLLGRRHEDQLRQAICAQAWRRTPGARYQLPLSKLHKVQGVVTMQRDGHVLNQASLSLVFSDDKSPAGKTSIGKGETAFSFPFVPEGDYVLRVSGAADVRFEEVSNGSGSMPPTTLRPIHCTRTVRQKCRSTWREIWLISTFPFPTKPRMRTE